LKTKLKKETEAKEENDKSAGYEEELQKEEEKYLEYKEQIKLAKENGQDPANVEESYGAKEFQVGLYFLFSTGHKLKHLWGLISPPPPLVHHGHEQTKQRQRLGNDIFFGGKP
jgi:hypothetical protein